MNKKSASQTKAQEVFQILPVQKQKHIKDNEPDVYKTIFSDDILLDANILNDFIRRYQPELNLTEKAQHVFSRLPLQTQSAIKHTEPDFYNALFNSKNGNNSILTQFLNKYEPLNEKVTSMQELEKLSLEDQLAFKNNFPDDYAKIISKEPKHEK
ncbi:hypothetical protein [Epilithonimonas vandammei]|uniref:hypothetical protein n=1 Tax=Epilithonimonas vandammei TaxID=2487072 RepID=UPI0028A79596|nr:hypothetical protein [Epilithonimonas vandammei]